MHLYTVLTALNYRYTTKSAKVTNVNSNRLHRASRNAPRSLISPNTEARNIRIITGEYSENHWTQGETIKISWRDDLDNVSPTCCCFLIRFSWQIVSICPTAFRLFRLLPWFVSTNCAWSNKMGGLSAPTSKLCISRAGRNVSSNIDWFHPWRLCTHCSKTQG